MIVSLYWFILTNVHEENNANQRRQGTLWNEARTFDSGIKHVLANFLSW